MSLGSEIAKVARATLGLNAETVWDWACDNGWKRPRRPNGSYLPWCAVAASYRVWKASGGAVSLAFGKPQNLSKSRFATGNASVPMISEDASTLGIKTTAPSLGSLVIVEVRRRGEPWQGRRSHVGIVTHVNRDLTVVTIEGNYGGKDVTLTRRVYPKENDRERCLEYVDMDAYESLLSKSSHIDHMETDTYSTDDGLDHILEAEFSLDDDVVAVVDGFEGLQRCRVVGFADSGVPLLQLCADDGQIVMGVTGTWPIAGRWDM